MSNNYILKDVPIGILLITFKFKGVYEGKVIIVCVVEGITTSNLLYTNIPVNIKIVHTIQVMSIGRGHEECKCISTKELYGTQRDDNKS